MAPTVTGSKACWAPQTRCKAFMGWSWAAAFSVRGRGHIVRPRAQLVIIIIIIIERMLWVMCSGSARQDATDDDTDEGSDVTAGHSETRFSNSVNNDATRRGLPQHH